MWPGSGGGLVGLVDGLNGDDDVDLVADHQLVALERDVEVDAPLLARQLSAALEPDTAVAPRVGGDAEVVQLEVDGLRDVLDRQAATGDEVAVLVDDLGALEGHRRGGLDGEEV